VLHFRTGLLHGLLMYTEYGDSSVTVGVMFNSDFVTETEMHHTDDMKINSDCELLYTQKEL